MDAFDADVLIYAAVPNHPHGRRVRSLFPVESTTGATAGIGSVLLISELLSKPMREGADDELTVLTVLLGRLELQTIDEATSELAAANRAIFPSRKLDRFERVIPSSVTSAA